MVARASHTYFLGLGAVKEDRRIPDSLVATKNGRTLYSEGNHVTPYSSHDPPPVLLFLYQSTHNEEPN